MKSVLNLLKLTDRYERKARLLPGLLSVLVVAPAMASLSPSLGGKITGLSVGAGMMAVCAVGLSYLASAAGRHFERKLWPRWPFDAPTHCWLRPDDASCSREQRRLWYAAITRLLGLDIFRIAAQGDDQELDRVINDAVRDLRHMFRDAASTGLLVKHNEDYGFARNFAGLRIVWLPGSCVSAGIAWAVYLISGTGFIWGIVSSVVLVLAVLIDRIMPGYVRQRADRYAESFFGTLSAVDRNSKDRSVRSM